MKHTLKILAAGALAVLFVLTACEKKDTKPTPRGPQLVLAQESLDLGTLKFGGEAVTVSTTIRNEGTNLLIMTRTETSCDCTTAALAANTLKPGEETTLEITYTPEDPGEVEAGEFLRTVSIISNNPSSLETVVFLKGILE